MLGSRSTQFNAYHVGVSTWTHLDWERVNSMNACMYACVSVYIYVYLYGHCVILVTSFYFCVDLRVTASIRIAYN